MAEKKVTFLNVAATAPAQYTKELLKDAKPGTEFVLGVMYGSAFDTVTRQNMMDADRPNLGFSGDFKFLPSDASRDTLFADSIFLPDALRGLIQPVMDKEMYPPKIKDGKEVENDRKRKSKCNIIFAYRQSIVANAERDTGFDWKFDWVKQPTAHDPIAEMIAASPVQSEKPEAEKPQGNANKRK